ncbi:MAG: hypothetical protein U5L11_04345 [Arhodomonas sp.]|nr:hypothetical protein [Arhodomonas sp.]
MSRQWLHRAVFVLSAVFVAPLAAAPPLVVYTSVLPVKTFVEAVGGERVDVISLVRQGRARPPLIRARAAWPAWRRRSCSFAWGYRSSAPGCPG